MEEVRAVELKLAQKLTLKYIVFTVSVIYCIIVYSLVLTAVGCKIPCLVLCNILKAKKCRALLMYFIRNQRYNVYDMVVVGKRSMTA